MKHKPASVLFAYSFALASLAASRWRAHLFLPGTLKITYIAGGLEDASVRTAVCDILEGGEDAFRERAQRLRVRLEG